MARLPDSRKTILNGDRTFVDQSIDKTEIEIVFPSVTRNDYQYKSYKEPMIGSKPVIPDLKGDCLHCSEPIINGVPIAKFKNDRYWIFGQFDSPECALGYIKEMFLGAQVQTWTIDMLVNVYSVTLPIIPAPPRFMLERFGGSLSLSEWRHTNCVAIKSPPLSTFAMFAECIRPTTSLQTTTTLSRPITRGPFVQGLPTQKEPVLLKVLAEKPQEKKKKKTTNLLD